MTTNPKSYEATSDEFPDLFPAFQKPDNQFTTSSYHAFKSIKFPEKIIWFSRYRQTSSFLSALYTHIRKNNLPQVDIFLREFDAF